jgi:RNA polymerase sigma-70 factor (ECF subfamily)
MDPQPGLLQRLRDNPTRADWDLFHKSYGKLVRHLAGRHAPSHDAEDLAQDVLVRVLAAGIPAFTGREDHAVVRWLWRITHNCWIDRMRRAGKRPQVGFDHVVEPAAPDELNAIDEAKARTLLLHQSLEIMQSRFEERTWRACWMQVAEGRSAAEIAEALQMSEASVYSASYRVVRRVLAELGGPRVLPDRPIA